jgi:predicted component of type VI protein secretion system
MELRISIHDPRTGTLEEALFRTSPIRIGRNALNDLLLDEPSVSQWHAQVAWGDRGIWFTDVGSSNGSIVGGARALPNQPVSIEGEESVSVGPMLLRVSRVNDGAVTGARRLPLRGALPDEVLTAMSLVDVAHQEDSPQDDGLNTIHDDALHTKIASSAIAQLQYLRAALSALGPVRTAYFEELREQIEALPPSTRGKIMPQLAREFPELTRAPEFLEIARHAGVEKLTVPELTTREWLETLIGSELVGAPGEEISDARILARVATLLQTFAQSLYELTRAKEHVVRELGLGAGEQGPESGRELLAYLLDFRVDGEERVSCLARMFADLAMHQMAMVSATREGIRSLVEEISPTAIEERHRSKNTSSWRDFLPTGAMQLWSSYRSFYRDISEGDRSLRHVFGTRFGRAYHAMTGRPQGSQVPPTPPSLRTKPPECAPEIMIPVTRNG